MKNNQFDAFAYDDDLLLSQENHKKLLVNCNLIYWYEKLYKQVFFDVKDVHTKQILEVGSGTSPLKHFLPSITTSDVLKLDYLDLVFDCHDIDQLSSVEDNSLDIITVTNVLHHLSNPLIFLIKATKKLKKGGEIRIVEPYISITSYIIFKLFHHEPVDLNIDKPILSNLSGPLTSSNQAIPYLIFFDEKKGWKNELLKYYEISNKNIFFYTSISYMLTGGISHKIPLPHFLYKLFFKIDCKLALLFPKIFASFFSLTLRYK